MNLMIFYSRMVASRRLWHSPMADPVRRTLKMFVGSHLPRPLTSPSCRASRHPAPALTSVECERVSGSRMETLVDDLSDIFLELWTVNRIKKSFTVQGRDTPVPAQLHVVKRAPLRRYRAIVVIRGWAARPRTRSCVWRGKHANRGVSERVESRRRNVVFFLSGRCDCGPQAVVSQDYRAR